MSEENLPDEIIVTYVGEDSFRLHSGRSIHAKRDPFRFERGKPVRIVRIQKTPEKGIVKDYSPDIKFFLQKKDHPIWQVEIPGKKKVSKKKQAEKKVEEEPVKAPKKKKAEEPENVPKKQAEEADT